MMHPTAILKKAILYSGIAFLIIQQVGYTNNETNASAGALTGMVTDVQTGEPVGWTQLLIEELNRSVSAHSDGSFHFMNIPAGDYTLKSFRIGYRSGVVSVRIFPNDTTQIVLKLASLDIETETVIVEADRSDTLSRIAKPDIEIGGRKLRQNLGRTLAETIDFEPGISQRTMGPAPARPVLRGLGGDRLMVVEDGERTGDLSATSSDHAVVIEPMTSERIEVIRGPEALIYGSNTLGGVINVSRGYVPTGITHRLSGTVSVQGETVNNGLAASTSLATPLGPFSFRSDASYRNAQDISVPTGTLTNTEINTVNGSGGLSLVRSWGYIGSAGSYYNSEYGIPPDAVAGHPGGVRIELNRSHSETKAEFYSSSNWMRKIELRHSYTNYQHSEIEYSERLQREIAGTGFEVVTHHFTGLLRFNQMGCFSNGTLGFWGEYRDHSTPTGRNFTPQSLEYSAAAFLYLEARFRRISINGALRFDAKQVDPQENVGVATAAGLIRERSFSGFSGSLSGIYKFSTTFSAGATLMRSLRAPGIEELFSEGPHLAVYTYEVGSADLELERGLGIEIFVDLDFDRGKVHLAAFRNDIRNYIFPENTGKRSRRIYSLFEYRFTGQNALMTGFEGAADLTLFRNWQASATFSYVHGQLTNKDEPLPRIPPMEGKLNLRYQSGPMSIGWGIRAATDQNRLGVFENPTRGFVVVNLFGDYNFSAGGALHTLSLGIENLLDTEYRKHLNWVKHIYPEPGRNVKLLYKMFF